jgi:hypothetical protein
MAAHVGGAQKGWEERANDGTNWEIMFPIQKNGSAVPEPPRVEMRAAGNIRGRIPERHGGGDGMRGESVRRGWE